MAEQLDSIDLKILKTLQENSKITNLELSKNVGLSPAPTLERVKKLENTKTIQSYHAKVDAQKIGLKVKTYVLVDLAWKQPNAVKNFVSKVKEIPEIVEACIITGEADFLLKIFCKDIADYEKLMFSKLSKIEEIERVRTLMTLSTIKNSPVLPFNYKQ